MNFFIKKFQSWWPLHENNLKTDKKVKIKWDFIK